MDKAVEAAVTILAAVVGVAFLAVLVSQKSQTSSVLRAFGGSFSQILGAAVSPVTGATSSGMNTGGYSFPGY